MFQVQTFIRHEILLSIKQDYNPDMPDSPNGGVVAVVDNIQTDVSSACTIILDSCHKKHVFRLSDHAQHKLGCFPKKMALNFRFSFQRDSTIYVAKTYAHIQKADFS